MANTILTARPTTQGVSLNWDRVSGATLYRVKRRAGGKLWGYLGGAVDGTSLLDSETFRGSLYLYQVEADTDAGLVFSSIAEVTAAGPREAQTATLGAKGWDPQ